MGYTLGATNIDNGLQQVNIHSYQELTSLNANKLLLGLFEHGVYSSSVEITSGAETVTFIVKKGSSFIFEKDYSNTNLVAKILLQDDATLTIPKSSLNTGSYSTTSAIIILASWDYNLADSVKKYINFQILPYSQGNLDEINDEKDLVVAIILNQQGYLGNSENISFYKIAYQNQQFRNVMKNTFNHMADFPVTFTQGPSPDNIVSITVGKGNCLLGDTYIHNKDTLTANLTNGIWPVPVATADPNLYNQIDVLRLKTERDDSNSNVPYLQWESFLKIKGATKIEEFLDGFDFTFKDLGYTLLFAVRDRTALEADTAIWPENCLLLNPSFPQIGIPETLSRFKLPVY